MPKVTPNLSTSVHLKNLLSNIRNPICMDYRIKSMSMKNVEEQMDFAWSLGASPLHKKPRYVIIGFQTNVHDNYENAAVFHHCNVRKITVTLNSERYPNIDIINDFTNGKYAESYYFAKQFRKAYYRLGEFYNDFMISPVTYKNMYPLFVFDTSRQSESLKGSITDISITVDFLEQVPTKTKCYCLILAEEQLQLSSDGKRMMVL